MVLDCGPNGDIVYVIVLVPPLAEDVIVPVFPPLHKGSTKLALVNDKTVGWVTVTAVVLVQPFTSVPVIV